ncbi:MAG: peptidyl-prolyl cis-trans isomerase, partial [Alphaproteobacteria bacterium]
REITQLQPMFGQSLSREQALQLGLGDRAVRALMTQALLSEEAARLGLGVSDDLVRQEIVKQTAFRNNLGQFDRRQFEVTLQMNNTTEDQYVAGIRRDLLQRQLINALTDGLTASDTLVNSLLAYRNEHRVASIAFISEDSLPAPASPTDAEIEAYYKENAKRFEIPEYRALTYVWIQPKDVSGSIQVSDDELKSLFDQQKAELDQPEKRTLAQARFADRAQAERAAELIKSKNTKLEDAAQEITGDKNSFLVLENTAAKDIPLETVRKVGFELPPNKVSDPIETPLGWYLIEVRSIVPAKTASFDDMKQRLRDEIVQERAYDVLIDLTDKLEETTMRGTKLADGAASLNIAVHKIAAIDRFGATPTGTPGASDLPHRRSFCRRPSA